MADPSYHHSLTVGLAGLEEEDHVRLEEMAVRVVIIIICLSAMNALDRNSAQSQTDKASAYRADKAADRSA
ncbi:hypothetical protein PCASD_24519 [Puccinia coronata f. sp. avenae]|uniref:Uncharacterized protein n=1 Tax=Puccinia coronata f. sp. avenae TaxID=200324 RepID=A0A2N5S178_9BASI|nr:hypothetical protein PCASD_24519 [Puccinia coronata f. sp. avenae]